MDLTYEHLKLSYEHNKTYFFAYFAAALVFGVGVLLLFIGPFNLYLFLPLFIACVLFLFLSFIHLVDMNKMYRRMMRSLHPETLPKSNVRNLG